MPSVLFRTMIGCLAAALLPALPMTATADSDDRDEADDVRVVRLPADAVYDGDYFAAGPVVEIAGTVNGDVYAAAGEVLVAGRVNGDLLAVGGTVTLAGTVTQDVRAVGGEVTIDGEVERNVTLAGGTVELTNAARVQGSLVAAGGRVRVSAPILRDAKVAAGALTLSDRVDGNLDAAAGLLRLTATAAVAGDLTYWSGKRASIDPQVAVGGKVTRKRLPEDIGPSPGELFGILAGVRLALWGASLVSTLVLGLLLLRFYPNAARTAVDRLGTQPMASLGIGLLASLLVPILAGLLLLTVVGFPLALLVAAWYLITLYLGRIFVMQWIGQLLLQRLGKPEWERGALLVGVAVYFVLALIPVLGGLVTLLALLFGLGATLSMKKAVYTAARQQSML